MSRQTFLKEKYERHPVRDSMALQLFVILNNLYLLDTAKDSKKD